jgi:hypothetical protein
VFQFQVVKVVNIQRMKRILLVLCRQWLLVLAHQRHYMMDEWAESPRSMITAFCPFSDICRRLMPLQCNMTRISNGSNEQAIPKMNSLDAVVR